MIDEIFDGLVKNLAVFFGHIQRFVQHSVNDPI